MWLVHALMLNDRGGYQLKRRVHVILLPPPPPLLPRLLLHALLFVSISSGNEKAFDLKPGEASVVCEKQFKNFSISPTLRAAKEFRTERWFKTHAKKTCGLRTIFTSGLVRVGEIFS